MRGCLLGPSCAASSSLSACSNKLRAATYAMAWPCLSSSSTRLARAVSLKLYGCHTQRYKSVTLSVRLAVAL
jgi:hypothetical protein